MDTNKLPSANRLGYLHPNNPANGRTQLAHVLTQIDDRLGGLFGDVLPDGLSGGRDLAGSLMQLCVISFPPELKVPSYIMQAL